jgi:hypothetical protein
MKANKVLNAIKLIGRYFNTNELVKILTSNFYSFLYYNSEVWMLQLLSELKNHLLLAASPKALKMALRYLEKLIIYQNLHVLTNRATPTMICNYQLAIKLYKNLMIALQNLIGWL